MTAILLKRKDEAVYTRRVDLKKRVSIPGREVIADGADGLVVRKPPRADSQRTASDETGR
jgi:hypothetical protein